MSDEDPLTRATGDGARGLGWVRWTLRVTRARHWVHFVALPAASFDSSLELTRSLPALARGALIAALVLAYGYLINSLSDRHVDRDPGKNFLVGRPPPNLQPYLWLAAGLAVSALAVTIGAPLLVSVATATAIVSGWAYSLGPRLKRWPILGTALNTTCFAPLLFTGMATASPSDGQVWLGLAFIGLLLQNQLTHEAADSDEDRAGGLRTTYLVFGPVPVAVAISLLGVLVFVASTRILDSSSLPTPLAWHALGYACLIPGLLLARKLHPRRLASLRRLHRAASASTGGLLFAALHLS